MRRLLQVIGLSIGIVNKLAPFTIEEARQAIMKQDLQALKKMFNNGLSKIAESEDLLMFAITQAKQEVALFMIEQYYQILEFKKRNDHGDTLLMVAIFRQLHKVIQKLHPLSDISACDSNKNTAFIVAAANGNIYTLKILLKYKNNDPLTRNRSGHTALHRACYYGQIQVVKFLLNNTQLKVSQLDKKGNHSLHLAAQGLNIPLTRYLMKKVKHSKNLLIPNRQNKNPLEIIKEVMTKINSNHSEQEGVHLDHLKLQNYHVY